MAVETENLVLMLETATKTPVLPQKSVVNPLLGARLVTVTGSVLESRKTTNVRNWLSAQGLGRLRRFQLCNAILPMTQISRARHMNRSKKRVSKRKLLTPAFIEKGISNPDICPRSMTLPNICENF